MKRSRALRREMTDAERKLWSGLRRKNLEGVRFRRQFPIGEYIVDFCSLRPKLVVEVDGGQHADAQDYDARRARFLQSRGFRVVRFWNSEVLLNLDGVLTVILETLAEPPSPPSPSTE